MTTEKIRVTGSNLKAYQAIASLPIDADVELSGHKGKFVGMAGYLLTLEFKSLRPRIRYFRIGMPEIEQIKVSSHD